MIGSVMAIDIQGGLSQAWSQVATFVPKFVVFLIILLVGWLIARAIYKGLDMLLRRVGLERAAERSGLGRLFQNSSWDTTKLISKIVYYAILLIVLQAAFGVFGPNPISNILGSIVSWLPKAIVAVAIVVIAAAIANAARELLRNMLSSTSYGNLLGTLAWAFIIALGAIAALNQIEVARFVTNAVLTAALAMIAGIGIVGLGGGLIRPMQDRWNTWLGRIDQEAATLPRQRAASDMPAGSGSGTPSGSGTATAAGGSAAASTGPTSTGAASTGPASTGPTSTGAARTPDDAAHAASGAAGSSGPGAAGPSGTPTSYRRPGSAPE